HGYRGKGLLLLPDQLAGLVQLEQGEEGDGLGDAVGALDSVVEVELAAFAEQAADDREPLLDRHVRARDVRHVELRGLAQQAADRLVQQLRVVYGGGVVERDLAQLGRQRRAAVAEAGLGAEAVAQEGRAVREALVLEHAREQLLGGLL